MIAKVSVQNPNIMNMPLVPMRGVVLFPDTINHFDAGREKTIKALESSFKNGTPVFLLAQRDIMVEEPKKKDMYRYGVVATVKQLLRFSDDIIKVLVECKYRGKMMEFYEHEDSYFADVVKAPVRGISPDYKNEAEGVLRAIREQIDIYSKNVPRLSEDIIEITFGTNEPQKIVEYITFALPLDFDKKQAILSENSSLIRLNLLLEILIKENDVLEIERDVSNRIRDQIDKNQRDYYLREQIKVLSSELGEEGDIISDTDEYKQRIKSLPLKPEYTKKVLKEVERLSMMSGSSQEAAVIRTYLDTIVDLPWDIYSKDKYDLVKAKRILEREHFGLDKVKDRILEFLAVRSLTDEINAQIICLVGPPGVGKTSIARSIAECMGKKFVRMSLGGVRDEAEIRGHRKTYVGAMPGRIINAISSAETSNPLILLDEIDKLGNDYKGDPSSALLEVLDPEQNNSFKDHFLDIPYDLSKVLFITTANDPHSIPKPLYDRMDVIELSSYTRQEKFKILKLHLLEKQLKKHGITKQQFTITDKAVYGLIDDYTAEAGVRSLERELAKLIRKSVRMIVEGKLDNIKIDYPALEKLLGARKNKGSLVDTRSDIGVANGLAWTSVGGTLLPIETIAIPGTGKVETTGSLGDVMKESAKIAVSLSRTLTGKYKVPENIATGIDIHIHAPEGAVPKDGPSAGVTLMVSLVSAVISAPIKKNVAMTGEVTLKGNVLPIGGLKEKLIAAFKEKMTSVIIPKSNLSDLEDVPTEIINALTIIPVETITEVLEYAIPLEKEKPLVEKIIETKIALEPKKEAVSRL